MIENKMYFCGIGGVSMAKLALFFYNCGNRVYGSDIAENDNTVYLREKGIVINNDQIALYP